jgi:hypothetical protein
MPRRRGGGGIALRPRLPRSTGSGFSDEEVREAWSAVQNLNRMLPQLQHFARSVTGNSKVVVRVSHETPMTQGNVITIRPPVGLGKNPPHQRSFCGDRNETARQICPACKLREVIEFYLFHEVGHIAKDSQAPLNNQARATFDAYLDEWHPAEACNHAAYLRAQVLPKMNLMQLANLCNPYLPLICNALEDVRVNEGVYGLLPGMRKVFDLNVESILDEGVDLGVGENEKWSDRPLDTQFMVGLFMIASDREVGGRLHPSVVEALSDERIISIVMQTGVAVDSSRVFELGIEAFRVAQTLGFCLVPKCMAQESTPGPPAETGESGESGEDSSSVSKSNASGDSGGTGDSRDSSDSSGTTSSGSGDDSAESGDSGSDSTTSGHTDPESDEPSDGDTDDGDDGGQSAEPSREGPGADNSEDAGSAGTPDETDSGDGKSANESESGSGSDGAEETPDSGGSGAESGDSSDDGEADSSSSNGDGGTDAEESDDQGSPQGQDANSLPDDRDGDVSTDSATGGDSGDGDGDGFESGNDSTQPGDGGSDLSDDQASGDDESEASGADGSGEGDGDNAGSDATQEPEDRNADDDSDLADNDTDQDPWATSGLEGDGSRLQPATMNDNDPTGPTLEPGTPDDIAEALGRFLMHGIPGDEETVGLLDRMADGDLFEMIGEEEGRPIRADLEDLLRLAIRQVMFFDDVSRTVAGVEVLTWPHARSQWRPDPDLDPEQFALPESLMGRAVLRGRLTFEENKRKRHQRNLKAGRINTRALGRRAPVNDPRVFQKSILPGRKDYVVVITGDASGSTDSDGRIDKVKRAMRAQGDLLDRLGVPFEMWFHSAWTAPQLLMGQRSYFSGGEYYVYMYPIKSKTDNWDKDAKSRLANMKPIADNLDGHTLEFVRKRIERYDATDKIIMYYTDGDMPAANYDEERIVLERETAYCRRKKIVLCGVGIHTSSPAQYGMETVRIDSDDDIIKVLEFLERQLER